MRSPNDGSDLDRYFVHDPITGRVRFTSTGTKALKQRFARCGFMLSQIHTVADLEKAIFRVTHLEYKQLTPAERERDDCVDAIEDLHFILDHIDGLPPAPLEQRRQRVRADEAELLRLIGMDHTQ